MPELPEVEIVKQSLSKKIKYKKIQKIKELDVARIFKKETYLFLLIPRQILNINF